MNNMAWWGCYAFLCASCIIHDVFCQERGMLYPRESESRQIQSLDGMWDFRADMSQDRQRGMKEQWYKKKLSMSGSVIPMPVPSSYNDITVDRTLQNFVGWVWYEREFFVSQDWNAKRVVLRLDSAHYYAVVWVNGKHVMDHDGGHLPFEGEVTKVVNFGGSNRLVVAVNNTLTPHTLPPGSIHFAGDDPRYPPGYFVQNYDFDFFNYAGIHRHVRLYTTPNTYIDDLTITTNTGTSAGSAEVSYKIASFGEVPRGVTVEIWDKNGTLCAKDSGKMSGKLTLVNPKLWWPYTMSLNNYGYLYTFVVTIKSSTGYDIYRQPFGVRSVQATENKILINNKPFYCHGAAKHEDSDIRGKGLDYALIARDFNMMKWMGINCFRTSHYPYAEEIMDQADQQGIVVIDECPGVGIVHDENFSNKSLEHHLAVMKELVRRDKNRPAVLFWSVANEPASDKAIAEPYFKSVIQLTRMLDPTRLVTFACAREYNNDLVAKYCDVICLNHYYGWYQDTGHLETIPTRLSFDLTNWGNLYKKPFIITEYGADTVAGLHALPTFVFTEDYQKDFLQQYHSVFDIYRKTFLVGEMVWNFADFMTAQTVTRVLGNKKGLLTRQRQPKSGAHTIRERYWAMINATSHENPFRTFGSNMHIADGKPCD